MNILVVEPHFDDAWINLGGYMLSHAQYSFFILTLSIYPTNKDNGTKILRDHYSHIDGECLGFNSLGFDDPYMEHLVDKYRETDYEKLFLKINNLESLDNVKNGIEKYGEGRDAIFWPLGMKHPQHILMAMMNPFSKCLLYREFPYFFYDDQDEVASKFTEQNRNEETVFDIHRVLDDKIRVFREAYRSQQFMLDLSVNSVTLGKLDNEIFWEINRL